MPLYEYECPKCGKFEVIQKFSDKPVKCDPDCKEAKCPKKATRIISESAFHLKGGGWYKTDYSSSSGSSSSKKAPAATADSSTETSTDSSSTQSKGGADTGTDKADSKKTLKTVKGGGGCGGGCSCH
jgi:putative FmdB family regulatory protein